MVKDSVANLGMRAAAVAFEAVERQRKIKRIVHYFMPALKLEEVYRISFMNSCHISFYEFLEFRRKRLGF